MQQSFCPSDQACTVHIFHQLWTVTWSGKLVLLSLERFGEFYSWNLSWALFDSLDAGVKASEFCGGEHRRGVGAGRGLGRWRRSRVHQEAVRKRSGYRSVHLGFPFLLLMQLLCMFLCLFLLSNICFISELGPLRVWLCYLTSSDVGWLIRDKLRPMLKHDSLLLYVHRNHKAR